MFDSINPATGELLARYPVMDAQALDAALDIAARAFGEWRSTPVATRAALLLGIAEGFERHAHELALAATLEMGKTYRSALEEVAKCAACLRYYDEEGPAMLAPHRIPLRGGGFGEQHWLPLGPILAIMPWNYPYWQVVRFLAPTLLAGNAALLKHAPSVQGCARLIHRIVEDVGAPRGLLQNLAITTEQTGEVIDDPRVAGVTLTGSEAAGSAVAQRAGARLKPCVLELGGSDPFIVMPSADLDFAVSQAVKARTQNTGQSCIAGKRMIVLEPVYDTFVEQFTAAMATVAAGDPMSDTIDMGPLASARQQETVLRQLTAATAAGGKLRTGGTAISGSGSFCTAGVVTDLPYDSAIAQEEIFGPIALVFRASDIDAAIAIANATPFGLGSSVWTNDPQERQAFVERLDTGMTAINQMLASRSELSFGGVKRSGIGRELGSAGLHAFMNMKSVIG